MNIEKKRQLRNILILSLLTLIGVTFAFTAFNQQVINDREIENRPEAGGRVHDYFNRNTENKDVFVENYGQTPIMVRIKLSEFMEYQERGQTSWNQVAGGSRTDVGSWTTYKPESGNINNRAGDSAAFNTYSNLTFGWTRGGEPAPWYLPTFNLKARDLTTAAAGHARDYLVDGATHPGEGTDNYWQEGYNYTNDSQAPWPGSLASRQTVQNMPESRPPVTLEEYFELSAPDLVGGAFWVMDEETGWAYWSQALQPGQATSYFIDAAVMTAETKAITGSYYYAIHVDSELISLEETFSDEGEDDSANLTQMLSIIRMLADGFAGNPPPTVDVPVSKLNFSNFNQGQRFKTSGQQFIYLGGGGETHMIMRTHTLRNVSWNDHREALKEWYDDLNEDLKEIVVPVLIPERDAVPTVALEAVEWQENISFGPRWLPSNFENLGAVSSDRTERNSAGVKQAFALSLADVVALTEDGRAFPNPRLRLGGSDEWWFLRTPAALGQSWGIDNRSGTSFGQLSTYRTDISGRTGGLRPALLVQPPLI
ncbi:hypothetical protein [Lactococcus petauri]|uniref:hypothetical protein n=1 Tax=Lactococcus petauri TaxID=1940789 RepID=UPI001F59F381|nr:hypothetical protein [Lactococcus petauri]